MAYEIPTAADLKVRYPAFATVDDAVVSYWITDALRFVDTSWSETDYAVALQALAAHNMASAGLGSDPTLVSGVPAGVTRMRSGSLDVSLTPEAANARVSGGFDATRYGQEFAVMLRRNRGGPRVTDSGTIPADPYYPYGYPYGYPA